MDLLEQVAAHLLLASEKFRSMMQALDPGWRYKGGKIDPALVIRVCGEDHA